MSFNAALILGESFIFCIVICFVVSVFFKKLLRTETHSTVMTTAEHVALLNQVKPTQPEAALAWEYITEVIIDRHILFDHLLEILGTLEGHGRGTGVDEFSIDDDLEDSSRVSVYYIALRPRTVTCKKVDLLDAYHKLLVMTSRT